MQAVAAYTATGPEQLSLEIGQLIQVRKKTQTGWWEGELQAKGKKKQVGWFPASYVKPLGGGGVVGGTSASAAAAAATATGTSTTNLSTTNEPSSSFKQPNDEVELGKLFEFFKKSKL